MEARAELRQSIIINRLANLCDPFLITAVCGVPNELANLFRAIFLIKTKPKPKTADQAGHEIGETYQNVGDNFDYKHITQNASLSFAKVGAI